MMITLHIFSAHDPPKTNLMIPKTAKEMTMPIIPSNTISDDLANIKGMTPYIKSEKLELTYSN